MYPLDLQAALEQARRNWGWYLALGVALIVLGAIAMLYPLYSTIGMMVLVGWLLIFGGVAESILAFQTRAGQDFFLHLLTGILEVVVGILVLRSPAEAALVLTLLIAAYLMVGGIFRLVAAFMVRFNGWGWVALAGVVSTLLGLALMLEWPISGLWFIGFCVGLDLILNGSAWLAFALQARRLPTAGS